MMSCFINKDKNSFVCEDRNIRFDKIKSIYENIGVILQISAQNDFHQFLKIKVGLIFTKENLNSSFIYYRSLFLKK